MCAHHILKQVYVPGGGGGGGGGDSHILDNSSTSKVDLEYDYKSTKLYSKFAVHTIPFSLFIAEIVILWHLVERVIIKF